MKNEIKEILLKISESINNHETIYLNEFERKNLLIYIHKLEMKETDEKLKTKIAKLEQENERLSVKLNKNMIERNNYLSRNEKAIEHIKSTTCYGMRSSKTLLHKYLKDLLNILQGEDKDE